MFDYSIYNTLYYCNQNCIYAYCLFVTFQSGKDLQIDNPLSKKAVIGLMKLFKYL